MRHEIPEIRLLSLDRRVRDNARELGFSLEPPAIIEAGKCISSPCPVGEEPHTAPSGHF